MIMCHTMVSRIFALMVWAACAAGLAYWGLRWLAKPLPVPPHSSTVSLTPEPKGDMARLLTAPETSPEAAGPSAEQSALAARIQLIGLMAAAGNGSGPSVALLAIDGKPAKAFRVGQTIDGEQVVQAITRQGVDIGLPGQPATATLPAQTLPAAATGILPSAMPDAPVSSTTTTPSSQQAVAPGVFEGRRLPPTGNRSGSRPGHMGQEAGADMSQREDSANGHADADQVRSGRTADGTKFRVMPL
jgi:general secretion pathway protein C